MDNIDKRKIPRHVAVIMDGNGRWAERHGNERIFGHRNGVLAVRETVEAAAELGISYLTLYAFSTENWNRPREEIDALMSLLVQTIKSEMVTLNKNNVRLMTIGDRGSLPLKVNSELEAAIAETSVNTGLILVLALSYSGRWEIVDAMRRIAIEVKNDKLDPEEVSCETVVHFLNTAEVPDPELLIRTSGEFRISNFLLWQIAYTEFYFTNILWPDFRKKDFFDAILDYQKRERRFGMVNNPVNTESVN